ncbi:MAG: hypothetical protein ACHQ7N_13940, partial [Candidatus Methylomirabilales bacterium]
MTTPPQQDAEPLKPKEQALQYFEAMVKPVEALLAYVRTTPDFDPNIFMQMWDAIEDARQRYSTALMYQIMETYPPGAPTPWDQPSPADT